MQKNDANAITVSNWVLLNIDYPVSGSLSNGDELKVELVAGTSTNSYFDDLRLHPVESSMTSSVYDRRLGVVTATLDKNNFATKYVYDNGGRVTEVWKEIEGVGIKKIKTYSYNFGRGQN